MKVAVLLAAVACACAQEFQFEPAEYPAWDYLAAWEEPGHAVQRRDVTYEHKAGGGKVFGTLGQNDAGLFGKAGYQRDLFDDQRGKLAGSLHGTRVLGPYGDSSHVGGSLNYKNDHATAALDVSKQIHGRTSLDASAGGRWPVGRNGDISAQGFYNQGPGGRDYGGRGVFNYRF